MPPARGRVSELQTPCAVLAQPLHPTDRAIPARNSRPHVDQEHLTLVIARIIAETQGLLNNFLRRTHGQWGLLHEVLHRRTAAVDRGAIKEGAELAARIL